MNKPTWRLPDATRSAIILAGGLRLFSYKHHQNDYKVELAGRPVVIVKAEYLNPIYMVYKANGVGLLADMPEVFCDGHWAEFLEKLWDLLPRELWIGGWGVKS